MSGRSRHPLLFPSHLFPTQRSEWPCENITARGGLCPQPPITPWLARNRLSAVVSFSAPGLFLCPDAHSPDTCSVPPSPPLSREHETSLGCTPDPPVPAVACPFPTLHAIQTPLILPRSFSQGLQRLTTCCPLLLVFLLLSVVAYCFVSLCWEVNSSRSRVFVLFTDSPSAETVCGTQ